MKFPKNDIISLLNERLDFNLAESTNKDLIMGELMDEVFIEELKNLRLEYGTSKGNPQLRALIARKLHTSSENIVVTNGAAAGIFLSILCCCEQGDEVLTVQPNFPPTMDLIEGLGFQKKTVRLTFDQGYQLQVNQILEAVSESTKLIILVTPLNPAGVLVQREAIEALHQGLEEMESDCKVLIDETYREATYGDNPIPDSFSGFSDRILTTSSLSKCHGTPGLRIGWLSSTDSSFLEEVAIAKMNTVISNSVLDELVAIKVLQQEAELFKSRKIHSQQGVSLTRKWVEANSQYIEWVEPQAGALCCVRLKESVFDEKAVAQFYAVAKATDVQMANGNWFGESSRVFRLGFGYMGIEGLEVALEKLEGVFQQIMNG